MEHLVTLADGRTFPTYEGETLSWSIGLYHTLNEERAGYPRMRAVIQAMRVHRPEALRRERYDMLKGSFDRIFGYNARKVLDVIDSEAPEAQRTIFD